MTNGDRPPDRAAPDSEASSDAAIVPGAVHRVRVESRDAPGRGLARLGRRELRIANALPGETVDARLLHVGRHVAVARVQEVVEASAERVRDACPHGEVCPGCGLRTSSPGDRLAFKTQRVVRALAEAGFPTEVVAPCVAAPREDGWRHKAFLTPRHGRRGITLGLFEEHSHRLVEIAGCPAHAPAVESALAAVRRAFERLNPRIYDARAHDAPRRRGWLRHVMVRASRATGEAVVVLVVVDREGGDARALAAAIREAAPHVVGVVANVHGERGNAPFGPSFETVSGSDALTEASGPHRLRVSAGSFFQVNPEMADVVQHAVETAAATAAPGLALDLYGGVGPTAVRLAAAGRSVVLVEMPGPSEADARHNLAGAPTGRVRVVAARVEDVAADLLAGKGAAEGERRALVVGNPPRSGLGERVRAALVAAPVPLLVYVSCDPESHARDARALVAGPYRLKSVVPFDLMPQTPHVEALATFRRPA